MNKKHSLRLLIISIIISTLLHFLVVYRYKTTRVEPPQPPQQSKSGGNGDADDNKTHIWVGRSTVPCDYYEGIGIQFNAITGIVLNVAEDSPAHKAGLKVNDEILTPLWNMDLYFGQKIDLIIVRNGKQITLPVIVDRICHE